MKKTALFSDILFTFLISGVFALCLFRHCGLSLKRALALAALCGTLCALSVGALLSYKRRQKLLKSSDEKEKQKLLLHLILLSDEKKTQFFEEVFSASTTVKKWEKLRLCTPSETYFLRFSFAPVTPDDVADLARFKTKKQKILLCDDLEEKTKTLCQAFHVQVRTGSDVYRLVKSADKLPEVFLGDSAPVKKSERFKKLCFAKSNAKRFLSGGVLILLASVFTPFSRYYLLFGTLLLIVATLIRIFGD